jgi:hypothetical protein
VDARKSYLLQSHARVAFAFNKHQSLSARCRVGLNEVTDFRSGVQCRINQALIPAVDPDLLAVYAVAVYTVCRALRNLENSSSGSLRTATLGRSSVRQRARQMYLALYPG